MTQFRYCSACGHRNTATARFCNACGQPMSAPSTPLPTPANTSGIRGLRTATMVIGLVAATVLFFGGTLGCIAGHAFESFEEVFDEELNEPDDPGFVSTTGEVADAGAWAMVISVFLFIGAGLARVAVRISLVMLTVAVPMLIGVIVLDTTSAVATAYYLATLLILICVVLMFVAYWRLRRLSRPVP